MQYRTVTCVRNDGVTVGDEVCSKLVGNKPTGSQGCNTQSCISCRYNYISDSVLHYDNYYAEYRVNGTVICGQSTPNIPPGTCGSYSSGERMGVFGNWKGILYQICGPF